MRFGAFLMPSHPPERSIRDGQRWDLDDLERLDALGVEEAWIGEHFTAAWEPCPAPDLLIAQALPRTKHIRLGPLGHLLPYHPPSGAGPPGRLPRPHGGGALPARRRHQRAADRPRRSSASTRAAGRNRRMTFEALEIMTRLWTQGGAASSRASSGRRAQLRKATCRAWATTSTPVSDPASTHRHRGLTPGSENHKLAGEKGYIPVSLSVSPDPSVTAQHWEAVVEGAARTGRVPDRRRVADHPGRLRRADGLRSTRARHRRHHGPLLARVHASDLPRSGTRTVPEARPVDARRGRRPSSTWPTICGSSAHRRRWPSRIRDLHEADRRIRTHLLVVSYDATDEREAWDRSLALC